MSLMVAQKRNGVSLRNVVRDYVGYVSPFLRRVDRARLLVPMLLFKSVEYLVYTFYEPRDEPLLPGRHELIFKITSRCTDRCPKCGIWKTPEDEAARIGVDLFISCLHDLRRELYAVTITGGEPLLLKEEVLKIARGARESGVPLTVVTNGFLISGDFLEAYAEMGHTLVVSVDTLDPDKWKKFRGRDHFDTVISNLLLARELLGPRRLTVQSVSATETKDDVPEIARFCATVQIKHQTQPYMDFGGTWSPCNRESSPVPDQPCAAWKNVCIYPNGDVVKCFDHLRIPSARAPLGSLRKASIRAILSTPRAAKVARVMKRCRLPCRQLSCNIPVEASACGT